MNKSPQELLKYLNPQERVWMEAFLQIQVERNIKAEPDPEIELPVLWTPNEGKQTLAVECLADILYYGGEAGGGKTDLLLGLALTKHDHSIIYRRQFDDTIDMRERLVNQILMEYARDSFKSKTFRLPEGRNLEFGGCQHSGSEKKYMGRAHDLKGFDELPHFLESQFRFLIGWLRSVIPGQRKRIVACGNPPTDAEGEWVLDFFGAWLNPDHPHPAKEGELRYYLTIAGKDTEVESGDPVEIEDEETGEKEMITPLSRTFIRASTKDNPYLMRTNYRQVLQALPEPLRSQLLHGSFTAGHDDDPFQVIPTEWVIKAQERWTHTLRPDTHMNSIGVDVARGGKDNTILTPRYGNWFDTQIVVKGKDTPDGGSVAKLVMLHRGDRASVNIDIVGIGSSAFDVLVENDIPTLGLNGANKSTGTDRSGQLKFANKRADWHWTFREALDPEQGINMCLPPSRQLRLDLTTPRWRLSTQGIRVELKEEIITRLGRSPDWGDSCIYAYAESIDWSIRQLAASQSMISVDAPRLSEDDYYDGD